MTEHLTKAIVLSKEPSGEADGRVSIYTQELGKIEVVARGLKKITSKFGHHLEPLNLIDCMVLVNRSNHLKGVLAENTFPSIRKNFLALEVGIKCLRVVDKAISMPERDDILWQKLNGFLKTLDKLASENDELAVMAIGPYFLARLAECLGILPDLESWKKDLKKLDFLATAEIFEKSVFGKIDLEILKLADLKKIEDKLIEDILNSVL